MLNEVNSLLNHVYNNGLTDVVGFIKESNFNNGRLFLNAIGLMKQSRFESVEKISENLSSSQISYLLNKCNRLYEANKYVTDIVYKMINGENGITERHNINKSITSIVEYEDASCYCI